MDEDIRHELGDVLLCKGQGHQGPDEDLSGQDRLRRQEVPQLHLCQLLVLQAGLDLGDSRER